MSKKKNNKQEKKKIRKTLEWIDIEKIENESVILKKGKDEEEVFGIKILPHDIFLDNNQNRINHIKYLRNTLNKLNMKLYHSFIFNPVNIDAHLNHLYIQMENEEDPIVKKMIEDDISKAYAFIEYYRELEFFICIKGKPGDKFDKQKNDFIREFRKSGLKIEILTSIDYENYIFNEFQNQMINDFYFSKGLFELEGADN